MQKMVEKMAEKTVNTTTLEPPTQPSYNNNIMSTENWLNYFFKDIEHLFGIEGYICLGCLMIQPVKLCYSEAENSYRKMYILNNASIWQSNSSNSYCTLI
jgi:hypothetical protein